MALGKVGGNQLETTLNIDSGTLYVDGTNNRVGIGTTSATNGKLVVRQSTDAQTGGIRILSTGGGSFYLWQDGSGNTNLDAAGAGSQIFKTGSAERMRIDSSGRVTMTYQPAFRATLITSTNTTGNYMIFESVDYNIGNHYNATTGIFTAPIAGRYMVSVQGFNENSQSSQLYVRVNNANKSYSLSYGPTYGMMSQHSVFNLAANDTVRVYCNAGELYAAGADSNSFSCYLLG